MGQSKFAIFFAKFKFSLLRPGFFCFVRSNFPQLEFLGIFLVQIFQSNNTLPHPIFPLDSSASAFYGQQPQQNPALPSNISNGTVTQCSVDPIDTALCQSLSVQLLPPNGFSESVSQVSKILTISSTKWVNGSPKVCHSI